MEKITMLNCFVSGSWGPGFDVFRFWVVLITTDD